jgi:hypothetical protein
MYKRLHKLLLLLYIRAGQCSVSAAAASAACSNASLNYRLSSCTCAVLCFVLQALEALLRRDDGDGTIATLIDEADGTLSSTLLAIVL